MPDVSSRPRHRVLVIHPERQPAMGIGMLIERSGGCWAYCAGTSPNCELALNGDWDAVFVSDRLVSGTDASSVSRLRPLLPESAILVGIIDSSLIDSPTLFGAGADLILYQPLVLADIERAMALAEAVQSESRQQSRDRLRKMTALHELAVASGHRTGTIDWMTRLVEAGCEILGADALAMWSLDRQNDSIHCIGSTGLTEDYIRSAEEQAPLLLDVYEDLPTQLSTHWITSEDTESNLRIVAPDAARELGIRQLAWLPVRDANRLYGHISFYFMSEDTFEKHDLVLADAFASIVAAALGTFWLQSEIRRTNRLYREHVESSPNGVIVCHEDGTVERSNPAVERITGYDRYELIDRSIFDCFVKPGDLPWRDWIELDADVPAEPLQLWLSRKNGERRRISCYARRVQFPDPRTLLDTETRVQVVMEDVTHQARRLVELELFHDLTRLISKHGSIEDAYELVVSRLYEYLNYRFVAIGNVIGRSRMVLRAFRTHMEGVHIPPSMGVEHGITGLAVRENRSVHVEDVSQFDDYLGIDDEVVSEIATVIRCDGEPVGIIDVMADSTQPLDQSDLQLLESIAAHLGLLIEQVTVQERLEQQALADPLTGMANRRAFMRHLEQLLRDENSTPAALFLVELDHFKSVNDRYGHLFGDEMLKQVAGRLETVLRENDLLARYGGDEIAMIFHDVSSSEAREIAERLRMTISDEPFRYNGSIADLTVSIGIALYPRHGRTSDELIGEADRAMYAAKLEGRNAIQGDVPVVD